MAIIIQARDFQHQAHDQAEAVSQEVSGIDPSVGSVGDSYDNAMAEAVIGLYKTELIRRRGPRRKRPTVIPERAKGRAGLAVFLTADYLTCLLWFVICRRG